MKFLSYIILVLSILGCSRSTIVVSNKPLPVISLETKEKTGISLFTFNNYTDTPRAGKRATNIVEGILLAKNYRLDTHFNKNSYSLKEAQKLAQKDGNNHFMIGGISEWRYKTGIDGEPAVSIQITLYNTQTMDVNWSATGSDSDWGNASIGTTAQDLILEMMSSD